MPTNVPRGNVARFQLYKSRFRRDALLLIIAILAITGGVYVIASFASRRVDTAIPGKIIGIENLPHISINVPTNPPTRKTSLAFQVRGGLQYCFIGQFSPQNTTLSYTNIGNDEPLQIIATSPNKLCVEVKNSGLEAAFVITGPDSDRIEALSIENK
ncbi:hypothetical protein KBC99_00080 [Candidatus Saccharibacteria bacterium]|nr:hypothetical protein [Candidatus Saccharibacteria bacterium]